jgi:hypothetical protein
VEDGWKDVWRVLRSSLRWRGKALGCVGGHESLSMMDMPSPEILEVIGLVRLSVSQRDSDKPLLPHFCPRRCVVEVMIKKVALRKY